MLVLTLVPVSAVQAGHAPVPALIGSCTFTLTLSRTPAVSIVTDPTTETVTWSVNASGPCTDNHTLGTTGSIAGSVTRRASTPAGCIGGLFTGFVDVRVNSTLGTQTQDANIEVAGAALVVVTAGPSDFVGGGPFVNATFTSLTLSVPFPSTVASDVHQCLTTLSDTPMTWTGVFAFVDPAV